MTGVEERDGQKTHQAGSGAKMSPGVEKAAEQPFRFLDYRYQGGEAVFRYQGKDGIIFTEKARFEAPREANFDPDTLDRALFLAFILIGTSYYKAQPTRKVELFKEITREQAEFFDQIYQEGMSQFAFENHLTRENLAEFAFRVDLGCPNLAKKSPPNSSNPPNPPNPPKTLILLSGGKDSLLTAELAREKGKDFRVAYITSSGSVPEVVREFGEPIVIYRQIDKEALAQARGLNGHVPVTLINQALALVQAILLGYNEVELGIGAEGVEPHAFIRDLPVNHQWSKTREAQNLLKNYLKHYVTPDITVGSPLENLSELQIAEKFAKLCWEKYGQRFSSCNVANYRQNTDNGQLKWCGKCAKCANSYLLFAPFVPLSEQKKLFGRDLFTDSEMTEIFKGLLGVDGVMKPFECVASVAELREAYRRRLPGYGELPFEVK